MTNEWNEFLAYTQPVTYTASGKRDTAYLSRMTFATIQEQEGLSRILTILARGYLYHDANGEQLPDDPYNHVEDARNALCAWCSIPEKEPNPECPVDFRHLSGSFPELVNEKGEGWYYRHVKNVIRFVRKNPELTSKSAQKAVEGLAAGFTANWKKRVRQLQVPIFAPNTKGAWVLRFDDILADALEAGPLRKKAAVLPPEAEEKLRQMDLNGVPYEIVRDVAEYYFANRAESEWVVLPVSNFDCYYGDTSFSKKWLSKIPKEILQREVRNGVCRIILHIV